jgi:hypothetical protein
VSQKRKDKVRKRQAKWQKARRPAESPQERQRAYEARCARRAAEEMARKERYAAAQKAYREAREAREAAIRQAISASFPSGCDMPDDCELRLVGAHTVGRGDQIKLGGLLYSVISVTPGEGETILALRQRDKIKPAIESAPIFTCGYCAALPGGLTEARIAAHASLREAVQRAADGGFTEFAVAGHHPEWQELVGHTRYTNAYYVRTVADVKLVGDENNKQTVISYTTERRQSRPRSHLMMGHLATLALLGLGGDR